MQTIMLECQVGQQQLQEPIVCKMLDCDTITQAKEKALDAIYEAYGITMNHVDF